MAGRGALARQFGRFFVSGGIATVAHYLLMWQLLRQGMAAVAATTCGFALGTLISYQLHRHWSFSGQARRPASFLRYAGVVAAGAALNALVVAVGDEGLGLPLAPVQLVASALVLASNFLLTRRLVFSAGAPVEHSIH